MYCTVLVNDNPSSKVLPTNLLDLIHDKSREFSAHFSAQHFPPMVYYFGLIILDFVVLRNVKKKKCKLWLIAMLIRWALAVEVGGSLCFKVDWTFLVSKKIRPFIFPLWQYDISELYFFRPPCLNSSYPRAYLSL